MIKENLAVCFFGIYNPKYSRNRVLIQGLEENNIKVIQCRTELKGVIKYFDLIKKHWKVRKQYDVLFVAFPGFQSMILAKFLTRKKIVFDSFAPLYESEVLDRKNTKKGSFKARYYWHLDRLSAKWADIVLLDTDEHIKYFVKEFGLKKEKFVRVLVGTDNKVLRPIKIDDNLNSFVVHFHGNDIPLQGIEYILETVKLLEKNVNIKFNIIGSSIKEKYEGDNYKNVTFIDNISYEKLPEYINKADICLGIFGNTEKAKRVIPNKVYEAAACKKPVITTDTPAIRELFINEDLFLIPTTNPEKLIEAILKLKEDPILRNRLAENAFNKLKNRCTPEIIAIDFLDKIETIKKYYNKHILKNEEI